MRRGIPYALAAVLLYAAYGQLERGYVWQPVRIVAGGYIPGFVAHPTEPGLIYARTDIGSVYRWNPSSAQWIPLTDFHSPAEYNLNGPESIALDPTDPNRLYIAAGMYLCGGCPFAVLASTDRGATFARYDTPFQMAANNDGRPAGERLAVNPFQPSELLMGTRKAGLWRSDDYAKTWTQVSAFPVTASSDGFGVQWVAFDPAHSGTVYAGVYTTSTVYRSTDGGATWAALPGMPLAWPFNVTSGTHAPAPERAVINPDGDLYVTFGDFPGPNNMNDGLVEKWHPADGSWTNITPPLDKPYETNPRGGFCGITQDPSRPGTVAVTTLDRWYPVDTVYLTHDGGATWTDLARTTSAAESAGVNGGNYYFDPAVFQPVSPWLSFGGTGSPKGTARFGWWMSAVLIDPTNPQHLLYATGATVYATDNLAAADAGKAPAWHVEGMGIEEVAVTALISPTAGAHLLSGMGDIGGFRHDDFGNSPAQGMYTNPVATTVGSLDWAGQQPGTIVRAQAPGTTPSTKPCNWGGISQDGGTTWQPLAACAAGVTTGTGGAIAVDAGGTALVWSGSGGASYSNDGGATWSAVTGLSGKFAVAADKVTPNVFYAYASGAFYRGAAAFQAVNTGLPQSGSCNGSGCGVPVASFLRAGDVWMPLGSNGLYHSTDGGATWTKAASVTWANSVAVGAGGAVYLYGYAAPANAMAIYRSDDGGATWARINDDAHQYGGPTLIQADSRVYGRVFLGMNGRGIVYSETGIVPGRRK